MESPTTGLVQSVRKAAFSPSIVQIGEQLSGLSDSPTLTEMKNQNEQRP